MRYADKRKYKGGKETFLCLPCKHVAKGEGSMGCPTCGEKMLYMGKRWRAPKKSNAKAWKLIEAGSFLWDEKALKKTWWWKQKQPEYWEHLTRQNPKHGKSQIEVKFDRPTRGWGRLL